MAKYKFKKINEGEQQAQQPAQPVTQQQPAQPATQQQNQQIPAQNNKMSEQDVKTFSDNLTKQLNELTNKYFQDTINGSGPISEFLKTSAEAKKFVDNIIAKNDNYTQKLELIKKFVETLNKTVNPQAQQQPAQQPVQQQPAQQNESFINKYQRKLFESMYKK